LEINEFNPPPDALPPEESEVAEIDIFEDPVPLDDFPPDEEELELELEMEVPRTEFLPDEELEIELEMEIPLIDFPPEEEIEIELEMEVPLSEMPQTGIASTTRRKGCETPLGSWDSSADSSASAACLESTRRRRNNPRNS